MRSVGLHLLRHSDSQDGWTSVHRKRGQADQDSEKPLETVVTNTLDGQVGKLRQRGA